MFDSDGGQWENLLFPTSLSPAVVKEAVVESIDTRKHGEAEAAKNLKDVMTERCLGEYFL